MIWLNYVFTKNDKILVNMPFTGLEFGKIILNELGLKDVTIEKSTPTLTFNNLAGGGLDPILEASGSNFNIKTTSVTPLSINLSTQAATFGGDVTVSGDFQVNGITTTTNVVNLDVSDNIIGLNRGSTSNANDSGLIIERGSTGDNAAFLWDESEDRFVFGTTTANPAATGNITYTAAPFGGKGLWTTTSAVTHWGVGPQSTAYGTLTWDTGYARVHATGSRELQLGSGGDTNAVIINGSNMSVAGNVTHNGLTMTDGTDVDQVKQYNMTFQLAANTWTDTGIDGTDLASGTYIVQMYVDDHNGGGGHYDEYYSGTMSWFSASTNSTKVDEIILHRAGHAPNNSDIQLRTQRALGTDSHDLMLQVKSNYAHSAAMNNTNGKTFRFKFRRLI